MAVEEKNVIMQHQEENGDLNIVYPVTKQANVIGLDEKIGQLEELITAKTGEVIKSIQRGNSIVGTVTDDRTYEIKINTVNPDKCIVIINNGGLGVGSTYQYLYGATLKSITENLLTINCNYRTASNNMTFTISWQLIEFH